MKIPSNDYLQLKQIEEINSIKLRRARKELQAVLDKKKSVEEEQNRTECKIREISQLIQNARPNDFSSMNDYYKDIQINRMIADDLRVLLSDLLVRIKKLSLEVEEQRQIVLMFERKKEKWKELLNEFK